MNTEEIESALYKAQQFMTKIFPSNPGDLAKLLMESFARGYDEAKPKWRSVKDDPPPTDRDILVRYGKKIYCGTCDWLLSFPHPDEWMEIPE